MGGYDGSRMGSLTGGRLEEEGLRSRGNTSIGSLNFSPAAR